MELITGQEDSLLITANCAATPKTLVIKLLVADPRGRQSIQVESLALSSVGVDTSKTILLAEGKLLSVSVSDIDVASLPCDSYVDIGLRRGVTQTKPYTLSLVAGYVGFARPLIFPFNPADGLGQFNSIVTNLGTSSPVPGADWEVEVPTGMFWRVLAVVGTLTTSATVANRNVHFRHHIAGSTIFETSAAFTQAENLVWNYSFMRGVTPHQLNDENMVPIPDWIISGGRKIRASTDNIQAGDQWSNVVVYGERLAFIPPT